MKWKSNKENGGGGRKWGFCQFFDRYANKQKAN